MLIDVEWDAGTTDFAWEYYFTMSSGDSTGSRMGIFPLVYEEDDVDTFVVLTGLDTIAVDESVWADDHFTYQIPLDGSMAVGYLYTRLYAGSTMVGVTVTVFKVW